MSEQHSRLEHLCSNISGCLFVLLVCLEGYARLYCRCLLGLAAGV
jgi:hypothetical protein